MCVHNFFNTPFVFNFLFNFHCNSEKDIISSIYKGGNWDPGKLSNLFSITEQQMIALS